jgi:hypothetical protein
MTLIESTRFPRKPTTSKLAAYPAGVLSMRAIIFSSRTFRPVAGRRLAFETLSVVKRLRGRFEWVPRFVNCDWRRLNSLGLADIGETPAAAERARLGDPLETPLGLVGGGVEAHGRSLLAHRASPLG